MRRTILIVVLLLPFVWPASAQDTAGTAYEQAREHILWAADNGITALSLWNRELTEVPPEITQVRGLLELDLNSNQLAEFPLVVTQLQLRKLTLAENQLTMLPPEIGPGACRHASSRRHG